MWWGPFDSRLPGCSFGLPEVVCSASATEFHLSLTPKISAEILDTRADCSCPGWPVQQQEGVISEGVHMIQKGTDLVDEKKVI